MSGSAPGLFICRGCRLHFMLRPACLLPAVRLSPLHGLLTPRLDAKVSLRRLGPATRCTDAYRDRTLTCWRNAASNDPTFPLRVQSFRRVTTHHAAIILPIRVDLNPLRRVGRAGRAEPCRARSPPTNRALRGPDPRAP